MPVRKVSHVRIWMTIKCVCPKTRFGFLIGFRLVHSRSSSTVVFKTLVSTTAQIWSRALAALMAPALYPTVLRALVKWEPRQLSSKLCKLRSITRLASSTRTMDRIRCRLGKTLMQLIGMVPRTVDSCLGFSPINQLERRIIRTWLKICRDIWRRLLETSTIKITTTSRLSHTKTRLTVTNSSWLPPESDSSL